MQELTVLMPVARVDHFLPIAIDSLKKQTFENFVCHILTGQLDIYEMQKLDELICNDLRFQVHQLSLGGIAFALNYGLNLSKTKYIARMDGDDVSHPLRFEKQIKFLEQNPNYVAVGCRVELINQDGNQINKTFKFYENNLQIRKALKYRMPFCHPAMIFRSSILHSINGYMYGNTAEDHELYLRIARNINSQFKNLPDKLFSYRRHENQLTNIKNAKKAYCNMAGFMFTEFLMSCNPIYICGIIANLPVLRRLRNFFVNN